MTRQLFVHAETTLLSTKDESFIRHQTWEYQGRNHRLAEWNQDDAKLFVDELDRGLDLLAQRVTPAFLKSNQKSPLNHSRSSFPNPNLSPVIDSQ
jgi:hypothetical protein